MRRNSSNNFFFFSPNEILAYPQNLFNILTYIRSTHDEICQAKNANVYARFLLSEKK